ncbi:SMP-30/gluconolactonase/LRE family protein [Niabella soli]|nr:SMP-30/gluconolactonase/LRE family protein [Niabella soli]
MIEIACEHKTQLGEGPVWDEQKNILYWVDIAKGIIHELNVLSGKHASYTIGQLTGAIALCNNNDLLVAAQKGPGIFNTHKHSFIQQPPPYPATTANRFNDGKCDAAGRFWLGTMALDEKKAAGSLFCMTEDFTFRKMLPHLTIPNGMAWTSDNKIFYFIDTPAFAVMAYDFDLATAQISNPRKVITIKEKEGAPDGMTIDKEGMLWIAHWDGWQVTRWDPETGAQLLSVRLPVARVTSCTFGGPALSDLYITTACDRLNPDQYNAQPHAGALFVWSNSGFTGMPANRFQTKHVLPAI